MTQWFNAPRHIAGLALLGLFASFGWACGPSDEGPLPSEPVSDGRPDIVIVVMEGLRWDRVGAYGHPKDTTPRLDALAAAGRRVERAYAHSSWTLPSIASLLTGVRPHEHGAGRSPTDPEVFGRLVPEMPTLAERATQAGYDTAAFVSGAALAPALGLDRGFGHYEHEMLRRDGRATAEAALRWLDRPGEPKLVLLQVARPPFPAIPAPPGPGSFAAQFSLAESESFGAASITAWEEGRAVPSQGQLGHWLARYDDATRVSDYALGLLVDGLEERGRLDRTMLVVTSDHGAEFGDHGGYGHGHALYSELTRVPLVMVGPGQEPGVIREMVSHRDLFWGLRALTGSGAIESSGECGPLDPFLMAAEAEPTPGRLFVMGNVLRGASRIGGTTRLNHLEIYVEDRRAELWNLDEGGRDAELASTADGRGEFLMKRLARCRGGMQTSEPRLPVERSSAEWLATD